VKRARTHISNYFQFLLRQCYFQVALFQGSFRKLMWYYNYFFLFHLLLLQPFFMRWLFIAKTNQSHILDSFALYFNGLVFFSCRFVILCVLCVHIFGFKCKNNKKKMIKMHCVARSSILLCMFFFCISI
jgi:hypothetical protein